MTFTDFQSFPLLGIVALSVVLLQLYLRKKYKTLDNVPGPGSASWITGMYGLETPSDILSLIFLRKLQTSV